LDDDRGPVRGRAARRPNARDPDAERRSRDGRDHDREPSARVPATTGGPFRSARAGDRGVEEGELASPTRNQRHAYLPAPLLEGLRATVAPRPVASTGDRRRTGRASWLAPRRALTVAGQRRTHT